MIITFHARLPLSWIEKSFRLTVSHSRPMLIWLCINLQSNLKEPDVIFITCSFLSVLLVPILSMFICQSQIPTVFNYAPFNSHLRTVKSVCFEQVCNQIEVLTIDSSGIKNGRVKGGRSITPSPPAPITSTASASSLIDCLRGRMVRQFRGG